jgi:hypothetical protein
MRFIERRRGVTIVAAFLATSLLGSCTTQAIEAPKAAVEPAPQEAPINSLALEQCLKVNDPATCGN